MTTQVRYPKEVYQIESSGKKWNDLENVLIDDWQSLAVCLLNANQTPSSFVVKDFGFNIPKNALIQSIELRHDFHRNSSHKYIEVEPPCIELLGTEKNKKTLSNIDAVATPIERSVLIDGKCVSYDELNSPDFGIKVTFPKNQSKYSGELFFDFMRVTVHYEDQKFAMGSQNGEGFPMEENPLIKSVGEEFIYTILFNNMNGISKEAQEVKINLPDGLEVEKYYFASDKRDKLDEDGNEYVDDIFDEDNLIWIPGIRGRGLGRLRLYIRCTGEGIKKLSAFNENTGEQAQFYVDVHPEDFKHEPNIYEQTLLKWNVQLRDDEQYQLLTKQQAVSINGVTMEFEKAQEKVDNLKEFVIKWIKRELKPKDNFKALDNVSFTVNRGERVGIIGFNGAGKSTLLKILAGVLKPTKGSIHVNGNIAPLLELGAGFDHNYSGRENIFLNGAILGYSREFLESKYDEIVEFSELEEFMELPIKNYSSGMVAKLGFAVATIVEPEILILDEILSVGDVRFQKKSGDKLKSMMGTGTTVLLVSHSVNTIRSMCNRVIWLDKGKVVMDGTVGSVCDAYVEAAKKASDDELSGLELG